VHSLTRRARADTSWPPQQPLFALTNRQLEALLGKNATLTRRIKPAAILQLLATSLLIYSLLVRARPAPADVRIAQPLVAPPAGLQRCTQPL
jgi:hypothetical protein